MVVLHKAAHVRAPAAHVLRAAPRARTTRSAPGRAEVGRERRYLRCLLSRLLPRASWHGRRFEGLGQPEQRTRRVFVGCPYCEKQPSSLRTSGIGRPWAPPLVSELIVGSVVCERQPYLPHTQARTARASQPRHKERAHDRDDRFVPQHPPPLSAAACSDPLRCCRGWRWWSGAPVCSAAAGRSLFDRFVFECGCRLRPSPPPPTPAAAAAAIAAAGAALSLIVASSSRSCWANRK